MKFKKLTTLFCAVAILATLIFGMALPASAEDVVSDKCGENVKWTLNTTTGKLTIGGFGAMTSAIPDYYKDVIKTVIVESNVTSLCDGAFSSFQNLTDITIAPTVSSIGNFAFSNCVSLESIELPNNLKALGENAFYYCENLKTVSLGNGLTTIKEDTFFGCKNLNEVKVGNKVHTIETQAFALCSNLTNIYLPKTLKSVEFSAFSGCENLKNVYIEDVAAWCNIDFDSRDSNPLHYADQLYLNNTLVTELVIPQGVTEIKEYAFGNLKSCSTIALPASLQKIGFSVFNDAFQIKQIIYCGSVEEYRKIESETTFYSAILSYHRAGNDVTVLKPPTHTEEGEQSYRCEFCEKEETSAIEKLKEHTYTYVPVDQFAHKSVCECGHILQSYTTHTRNEGTVLVEATHLTQGEISFTCVDCGEIWKEYSKKLPDHSYTEIEKYSEAQHAQKCACGNAIYADHNWDDGVVVTPASKDNAGLEAYTCTDCGETKTEIIPQKEEEGCNATLLDNSAFLLLIGGAMLVMLKKKSK